MVRTRRNAQAPLSLPPNEISISDFCGLFRALFMTLAKIAPAPLVSSGHLRIRLSRGSSRIEMSSALGRATSAYILTLAVSHFFRQPDRFVYRHRRLSSTTARNPRSRDVGTPTQVVAFLCLTTVRARRKVLGRAALLGRDSRNSFSTVSRPLSRAPARPSRVIFATMFQPPWPEHDVMRRDCRPRTRSARRRIFCGHYHVD